MGGIEVKTEYKYLGIKLDDKLKFKPCRQVKLETHNIVSKKAWLLRNPALTGHAKAQLWHSLFLSKWTYALLTISSVSGLARCVLTDMYYLALKKLLNVKQKVNKMKTLDMAVGAPWTCYLSSRAK